MCVCANAEVNRMLGEREVKREERREERNHGQQIFAVEVHKEPWL